MKIEFTWTIPDAWDAAEPDCTVTAHVYPELHSVSGGICWPYAEDIRVFYDGKEVELDAGSVFFDEFEQAALDAADARMRV